MRLYRVILWPIIIVVGLYAVLAIAVLILQNRIVFFPIKDLYVTPDQVGLQYEDVFIDIAGGDTIHGWYFAGSKADSGEARKVVILCHGNAGNIAHRLETAEFMINQGADILLWDYRGYGRSTGHPTEANLYDDAEACFRWVQKERGFDSKDIIIFGRSLGGAVAIELARRVDNGGLVVESSFTSVVEMGKKMFPFMPIGWLIRFKFNSLEKIGSVHTPIMVAHSSEDEIISFDMGRRLFEAAAEPKRFVQFGGGHNERRYLDDSAYIAAWQDLFRGRLGANASRP